MEWSDPGRRKDDICEDTGLEESTEKNQRRRKEGTEVIAALKETARQGFMNPAQARANNALLR
jgi:hypothetical protein